MGVSVADKFSNYYVWPYIFEVSHLNALSLGYEKTTGPEQYDRRILNMSILDLCFCNQGAFFNLQTFR